MKTSHMMLSLGCWLLRNKTNTSTSCKNHPLMRQWRGGFLPCKKSRMLFMLRTRLYCVVSRSSDGVRRGRGHTSCNRHLPTSTCHQYSKTISSQLWKKIKTQFPQDVYIFRKLLPGIPSSQEGLCQDALTPAWNISKLLKVSSEEKTNLLLCQAKYMCYFFSHQSINWVQTLPSRKLWYAVRGLLFDFCRGMDILFFSQKNCQNVVR